MIVTVVVALFGVIATVVVSEIYFRRSDRSQAGLLREALKESRSAVDRIAEIEPAVVKTLETTQPRLAVELHEAMGTLQQSRQKLGTVIAFEGDPCPNCGQGTLNWKRWGPGPFGFVNAWFECPLCKEQYPGREVFGD